MLDRAFELLLKAIIVQRKGSIREVKKEGTTIGFDVCLRKCLSDAKLKYLTDDEAIALQTLNTLRDAAQHYMIEVSEEQLYVYAQASVTRADGTIGFERKGKKTVDVATIQERFKSLGIAFDWKPLDNIVSIRNEIEHFHSERPESLVREVLADALPLIQTILTDLLGESVADVVDAACWATLREVKDIFDRQLAAARESFSKVPWDSILLEEAVAEFKCTSCGSSLVRQVDSDNDDFEAIQFQCADCKADLDWTEVLTEAIQETAKYDNFRSVKDGGEPVITTCWECGKETYSVEDGRCLLNCGATAEDLICSVCNTHCSPDDYVSETGMCGSCNHTYNKMMDED